MEMVYVLIIVICIIAIYFLIRKNASLKTQIQDLIFKKQSLASKYGKMTEQFMPFLDVYPYNEQNFRFIGSPIDGIQFEDDKIVFIEFKTGDSRLTKKQESIKELVLKKKIDFEVVKIK